MPATEPGLTDRDRHSLFAACMQQAQRFGGDEIMAGYFYLRASSSRISVSLDSRFTIADMAIDDWCEAVVADAPARRVAARRGPLRATERKLPRAAARRARSRRRR